MIGRGGEFGLNSLLSEIFNGVVRVTKSKKIITSLVNYGLLQKVYLNIWPYLYDLCFCIRSVSHIFSKSISVNSLFTLL